jgi:hypothetical protein
MDMTAKAKKYWILAQRVENVWQCEFGSYDRSDVVFERRAERDKGVKAKDLFLSQCDDTQAGIIRLVEWLNAGDLEKSKDQ